MIDPDWPLSLEQALAADRAPLALGFSGGLDSSVLLHRLAQSPIARARGLRALHVDHGLHPRSHDWSQHCVGFAASLGIDCTVLPVTVAAGGSLEANARTARYAALSHALRDGEWLLTAQHRDDQAETLLLQLLRGAGSGALGAMRSHRPFGEHVLWRPLLEVPRAVLERYAAGHRLQPIDDPANRDLHHSRNRLRHQLLPLLREHWPQADAALAASARLLADDAALIEQLAASAHADCRGPDPCTLQIAALQQLPPALQRHVLRRHVAGCGASPIPSRVLERVDRELMAARIDATPSLHWRGGTLRRHRGLLYCQPPQRPVAPLPAIEWTGQAPIALPTPFGRLELLPHGVALPAMRISARRGGESLALPGRPRKPLKQLLQESGTPPWQRERLPLLWSSAGELLAAGDLAISASLQQQLDAHGVALRWRPAADAATNRD